MFYSYAELPDFFKTSIPNMIEILGPSLGHFFDVLNSAQRERPWLFLLRRPSWQEKSGRWLVRQLQGTQCLEPQLLTKVKCTDRTSSAIYP